MPFIVRGRWTPGNSWWCGGPQSPQLPPLKSTPPTSPSGDAISVPSQSMERNDVINRAVTNHDVITNEPDDVIISNENGEATNTREQRARCWKVVLGVGLVLAAIAATVTAQHHFRSRHNSRFGRLIQGNRRNSEDLKSNEDNGLHDIERVSSIDWDSKKVSEVHPGYESDSHKVRKHRLLKPLQTKFSDQLQTARQLSTPYRSELEKTTLSTTIPRRRKSRNKVTKVRTPSYVRKTPLKSRYHKNEEERDEYFKRNKINLHQDGLQSDSDEEVNDPINAYVENVAIGKPVIELPGVEVSDEDEISYLEEKPKNEDIVIVILDESEEHKDSDKNGSESNTGSKKLENKKNFKSNSISQDTESNHPSSDSEVKEPKEKDKEPSKQDENEDESKNSGNEDKNNESESTGPFIGEAPDEVNFKSNQFKPSEARENQPADEGAILKDSDDDVTIIKSGGVPDIEEEEPVQDEDEENEQLMNKDNGDKTPIETEDESENLQNKIKPTTDKDETEDEIDENNDQSKDNTENEEELEKDQTNNEDEENGDKDTENSSNKEKAGEENNDRNKEQDKQEDDEDTDEDTSSSEEEATSVPVYISKDHVLYAAPAPVRIQYPASSVESLIPSHYYNPKKNNRRPFRRPYYNQRARPYNRDSIQGSIGGKGFLFKKNFSSQNSSNPYSLKVEIHLQPIPGNGQNEDKEEVINIEIPKKEVLKDEGFTSSNIKPFNHQFKFEDVNKISAEKDSITQEESSGEIVQQNKFVENFGYRAPSSHFISSGEVTLNQNSESDEFEHYNFGISEENSEEKSIEVSQPYHIVHGFSKFEHGPLNKRPYENDNFHRIKPMTPKPYIAPRPYAPKAHSYIPKIRIHNLRPVFTYFPFHRNNPKPISKSHSTIDFKPNINKNHFREISFHTPSPIPTPKIHPPHIYHIHQANIKNGNDRIKTAGILHNGPQTKNFNKKGPKNLTQVFKSSPPIGGNSKNVGDGEFIEIFNRNIPKEFERDVPKVFPTDLSKTFNNKPKPPNTKKIPAIRERPARIHVPIRARSYEHRTLDKNPHKFDIPSKVVSLINSPEPGWISDLEPTKR